MLRSCVKTIRGKRIADSKKIIVKKEAKSNNLNLNLKTMASIKNFDNFPHTINGLVYNTVNRSGKTAPT